MTPTTDAALQPGPLKKFIDNLLRTKKRRDLIEGYIFILPVVLGLIFFTFGPMLASLFFSLTDYPILRAPEWVGLGNFIDLLTKERWFWQAVKVTVLYAVIQVPLGIMGAFLLALFLNQRVKGSLFSALAFICPPLFRL